MSSRSSLVLERTPVKHPSGDPL